jgi:4-amino-4-deoxy-L-arabinose transferase-like glycosyltransferase
MEINSVNYKLIIRVSFALLAILYLGPLGKVPVHTTEDECRRAIIPMEMCISGDYLKPTLNGELYLNKPPLYNWIVAMSYKIIGAYDAYSLRFPVVLSILLNGLLIFFVVRKYCDEPVAAMAALAFVTNWRTLTLDSMLGLLEHTLALVIYAGFLWIFIFGEKKKYLILFAGSYFIAAIGFLIKGLPALAHHGIALLVYFVYSKKFKLLFSWYHIAGVALLMISCALFYIPFSLHNHIGFSAIADKLFSESAKRYGFTGIRHFIYVLIDFPLDFIKHFLPWTIFIIVLFRKGNIQRIFENRFVAFNALLFVANIPIYWMASLKNPHYLYFFLPLLFTVLFYLWDMTPVKNWRRVGIEMLLGVFIVCALVAAVYAPFSEWLNAIDGKWVKSVFITGCLAFLLLYYFQRKALRLFVFVGVMLVLRLVFNLYVLPQRVEEQMKIPRLADQIQEIVKDKPLLIAGSYPAGFYDPITYPLEVKRNEILRMAVKPEPGSYYLMDEISLKQYQPEVMMEFPFRYADLNQRIEGRMFLVKVKSEK